MPIVAIFISKIVPVGNHYAYQIVEEDAAYFLTVTFMGSPIRERILKLDAERYERGDQPLSHLIDKYLSYLTRS